MSTKETTETYLNLDSDQFNSWIKEFDNKYKTVEKSILNNLEQDSNSFDNFNLSEENDSVDIETGSESEVDNDITSNIFIKKEKNTESINSSSSRKVQLYNKNKTHIRTNPSSDKTTSNKTKRSSQLIISDSSSSDKIAIKTQSKKESLSDKFIPINNNSFECKEQHDIISLTQLNSMIPTLNNKYNKVISEPIINVNNLNNKVNQKKTLLGEQALYRFITNRRRI